VPAGIGALNAVSCVKNTTDCWAVGKTSPGGVAILSTVESS
jgi:hypothetical protein